MRTALVFLCLFAVISVRADDQEPESPHRLFSAEVGGKVISVYVTIRPFDPSRHKVTELITDPSSDRFTAATIDGRAVVGTDSTAPGAGTPQLAGVHVLFGKKRVEVPESLLTHVFSPSLGLSTFDHRYADSMVAVSADGKAVLITLGVGDGGGASTYVLYVGEDGTCTNEVPRMREP